jgi:hypothetical protein
MRPIPRRPEIARVCRYERGWKPSLGRGRGRSGGGGGGACTERHPSVHHPTGQLAFSARRPATSGLARAGRAFPLVGVGSHLRVGTLADLELEASAAAAHGSGADADAEAIHRFFPRRLVSSSSHLDAHERLVSQSVRSAAVHFGVRIFSAWKTAAPPVVRGFRSPLAARCGRSRCCCRCSASDGSKMTPHVAVSRFEAFAPRGIHGDLSTSGREGGARRGGPSSVYRYSAPQTTAI